MAAGTFLTQNKVRPGVYINFETEPKPLGGLGDRGVTTIPVSLSWGATKEVITVEAGEAVFDKLGYTIADPEMLLVREALKHAKSVLLYRLNGGTKASATLGTEDVLTVTANHAGIRGNDITVVIQENIDHEDHYDVLTLVNEKQVDTQTVATIQQLQQNLWVTFSGTGVPQETAGLPLTSGTDGTVTNQDYTDYLSTIENYQFNTMALPVTDPSLKAIALSFVKRLREDEGKKIQCVLENYPIADYEGIISVKNGVILADGTEITPAQATAWVAGATAKANVNQSLTYMAYDGSVDAKPRYTNTQTIAALQAGEFVFTADDNKAVVEQDINTLTSFTPTHGKAFSKNRVVRVLDSINNDLVRIFSDFYIGKVDNNTDGRNLLKGECINYLGVLQGINAIQNFDSQIDLLIQQGNDLDSVYIEVYIQPVDSIEKLYMKVKVE